MFDAKKATKIRPRHPLAGCRCFFSTTSEAARRPDSSAPCTVDGNVSLVPSPAKCKAPSGEAKVRRSREELPTAWTKNTKCGQAVRGVWQQKWWWLHRSSPKKTGFKMIWARRIVGFIWSMIYMIYMWLLESTTQDLPTLKLITYHGSNPTV